MLKKVYFFIISLYFIFTIGRAISYSENERFLVAGLGEKDAEAYQNDGSENEESKYKKVDGPRESGRKPASISDNYDNEKYKSLKLGKPDNYYQQQKIPQREENRNGGISW